jgi:hypothetical protein
MAVQFMNMPAAKYPDNAQLDLASLARPLFQGLNQYSQGVNQAAILDQDKQIGQTASTQGYGAAGKQALSLGRLDEGTKLAQAGQGQQDALRKRYGALAQKVDMEADPARRSAMWQGTLERMKREGAALGLQGEYDSEEMDPMTGPKLFMAQAGLVNDPLERQGKQADLDLKRAQISSLQQKAGQASSREAKLMEIGIDPNSAEGQAFILNGKLPAAAYEQMAQRQRRAQSSPNIAAGLDNLNKLATDYDDASFTNAVGPFQGSTPDGLLGSIPINIARLFGEISNASEGGAASPTEVRNNIVGNTETLAAAIKPLIRAPGEGVWTDQDQARLVAIVGDLAQARDKDEYRRRLNAVRDRIKTNFNLDIPFEAQAQPNALESRRGQPFVDEGGWTDVGGVRIREKR